MKTSSLSTIAFCVASILTSAPAASAETVILGRASMPGEPPAGLTNLTVNVPAGKMMIIRASSLPRMMPDGVRIQCGGGMFAPDMNSDLSTRCGPRYLAGPCVFTYAPEMFPMENCVFDYDVVSANGIQTEAGTNIVVEVPTGKRLRFLDGSYPVTLTVTLTNGASAKFRVSSDTTDTATGVTLSPVGFELAGPLTVRVGDPTLLWNSSYLTYFFAADVIQAEGQSIQSPVGSIVTVQKSVDLETWFPAFIVTSESAPKAFYRLNVTR